MSMKKKITALLACVLVVAIAAISLGAAPGWFSRGQEEEEEEAVQQIVVETEQPFIGNIVVTGEFIGTVEPGQQVVVLPKAAGEVLEANFSVGDTVQKGDVLMRLDSTALEYTIAQTQASLSSAQALANYQISMAEKDLETYQFNLDGGYNTTLLQAQAAVDQAEIGVQSASSNLSSARTSLRELREGKDYMDDASYEVQNRTLKDAIVQYQLALENAQTQLEQAEANLRAAKVLAQEQEVTINDGVTVAELSADMTSQYIALEKLQNDLADYTVTAPIGGIIESKSVDVFDMVSGATAAYVISNKDNMEISFSVSENNLQYLDLGDGVTVDKNGATWPGVITEISTMVSPATGLYDVKATVENPPFQLNSGSTLKVYANTRKAENDLMIPIDAVYYENNLPYVYLYQNGIAVRREIETGIADETYVQVVSGLSLSDEIIATWNSKLSDGMEVVLPGQKNVVQPVEVEEESGDTSPEQGDDE